jgi:hypothetical protein
MKRIACIAATVALTLSAATAATASDDGKNRKVTVENLSSQSINYLYASPVTSTTWEEDLLGQAVIASATSKVANIDNGTNECNYDLKVVMANGKEYIHRGVNICAVGWWAVGDTADSLH